MKNRVDGCKNSSSPETEVVTPRFARLEEGVFFVVEGSTFETGIVEYDPTVANQTIHVFSPDEDE